MDALYEPLCGQAHLLLPEYKTQHIGPTDKTRGDSTFCSHIEFLEFPFLWFDAFQLYCSRGGETVIAKIV